MQINPINNQKFNGHIIMSAFDRKHQQAIDVIYPALEKQVKPIKNLNLHISGGLYDIRMWSHVGVATPTIVDIKIESLDPKIILEAAQDLINKHINSASYKEYLKNKPNLITLFFSKVKSLFNIKRQ